MYDIAFLVYTAIMRFHIFIFSIRRHPKNIYPRFETIRDPPAIHIVAHVRRYATICNSRFVWLATKKSI